MNDWIWLSAIEGLGPMKKKRLLEKWKTPDKIYSAKKEELLKIEGMTEKLVQQMEKSKNKELLQRYEAYMTKNHIQIINIVDEAYPEKLRQIYDPPITLYAIGDVSLLQRVSIGMVGSREPTEYGVKVAQEFSKVLNQEGIVIVSGLAKGIDAASHEGALLARKETIAVLRMWSGYSVSFGKYFTLQ